MRTGNFQLLLMVLPAMIYVFIFSYLPMGGIIVAFKDFKFNKGILDSEWAGFKNFEFLFRSNTFVTILRNTIGYNLLFMFLNVFFAVFFALLLERIREHRAVNTTVLSEQLSGEEMSLLIRLLDKPEVLNNADGTLQDYIKAIKKQQEAASPLPDLRQLADRLKNDEGKGYRS